MRNKHSKLYNTISFVLPFIILFGQRSFTGIRIAGLTISSYRLLIPLLLIFLLAVSVREKEEIQLKPGSTEKILYCVIAVWIVYGLVTIALFPYSDFHDGILELLALALGAVSVSCIILLCIHGCWDSLVTGIRAAVFITIIIGIWEIHTANHLSTSRFMDPEFINFNRELFGAEADTFKWHVANSIFYNENDFSAMLAVFAPFFIIGREKESNIVKAADLIALGLMFCILEFNDAFICFLAFWLGVTIAILFGIRGIKSKLVPVIALVISRIALFLYENLYNFHIGLGDTLLTQIDNNENGMGSMYYRINTYKMTLSETFRSSKGLGFGAGSFPKYFGRFAESHMIMSNPHCFWLEILSEYGVIIFIVFVAFLIYLMIRLIRKACADNERMKSVVVIASGAALVIASCAPSSYLKAGYYWIPIALAVFLSDEKRDNIGYSTEK